MDIPCRTCAQPFTTNDRTPRPAECSSCRVKADWHRLPIEIQRQMDALLRRRGVLAAIVALREQDPGVRLLDAQQLAETRLGELDDAGEVVPAPSVTVDSLLARARGIEQRVVAVEGYWDGDSHGWYARLVAVVERPRGADHRYDEMFLGTLSDADAPELAVARTVADALGVPFHFSQSERADLDQPRWWDRR